MLDYLWIMFGGALGTGARYWLSGFTAQRVGEVFPVGTLLVNITGAFVIGFFAAMTDPLGPFVVSPRFRQFFAIGICGGYTTFSSFSLQTLDLMQEGDWLKASLNIVVSVVGCIAAVWLGRVAGLALSMRWN